MKCRVFPLGVFYVVAIDFLALLCLGFEILLPSKMEIWLWIISSIMFVLFPILFSIYILSFSLDIIVIDAEGIKKYHYGKIKKQLSWNEIVTFKIYPKNDNQGWIYLSNYAVDYNFFPLLL